jgi:hypothetical protein
VRINFLHDWLGERARHGFDLLGYAIVLPLLVWLTWGLWDYWYGAFKTAEKSGQSAWYPPVWSFRLVLFLGILAWTLQTIAEVVKSALWSCRALPLWTDSPHGEVALDQCWQRLRPARIHIAARRRSGGVAARGARAAAGVAGDRVFGRLVTRGV